MFLAVKQTAFAETSGPKTTAAAISVPERFAQLLSSGQYTAASQLFDARMTATMPPTMLGGVWHQLMTVNGLFKRLSPEHRTEPVGPYKQTFIPAVFERQTIDLKIVTNSSNKIAGFFVVPHATAPAALKYTSPPYVDSEKFSEKPTKVVNGDLALDAAWTMPKGVGPFPAVVLVHGSGPNDRDETIGPNKPFKDLADGLASKGIAVLRYEKRTKQFPAKVDRINVTVKEETVDDAVAAVRLAGSTESIDSKRVFVLGHSLGGMLAPRIAKECPQIAGMIILAGTARPLEDSLLDQITYLSGKQSAAGGADTSLEKLKQQVRRVKSSALNEKTASASLPLNIPAKYWLDLRGYDPAALAKRLGKPMLIMQGGRDYQVTAAGDYQRWQQELGDGKQYQYKFYPDLNHLFAAGEGTATPQEYMSAAKHVDEHVIDDIVDWVEKPVETADK